MRLGRVKPSAEHRKRALPLRAYLPQGLPPAPLEVDHTDGVKYGLYRNDSLGDCTCAALANFHATAAMREGRIVSFSDDDVVAYYLALTGGADDGLCEVDVLSRAQAQGFPLSGAHRLAAWVRIDPGDLEAIKNSVALFHAVYVGAELPLSSQREDTWDSVGLLDNTDAPGSWGGHALISARYDSIGPTFVTWGREQRATWAWWKTYCDEAYALLDAERAQAAGVDWAALTADLALVGERP